MQKHMQEVNQILSNNLQHRKTKSQNQNNLQQLVKLIKRQPSCLEGLRRSNTRKSIMQQQFEQVYLKKNKQTGNQKF